MEYGQWREQNSARVKQYEDNGANPRPLYDEFERGVADVHHAVDLVREAAKAGDVSALPKYISDAKRLGSSEIGEMERDLGRNINPSRDNGIIQAKFESNGGVAYQQAIASAKTSDYSDSLGFPVRPDMAFLLAKRGQGSISAEESLTLSEMETSAGIGSLRDEFKAALKDTAADLTKSATQIQADVDAKTKQYMNEVNSRVEEAIKTNKVSGQDAIDSIKKFTADAQTQIQNYTDKAILSGQASVSQGMDILRAGQNAAVDANLKFLDRAMSTLEPIRSLGQQAATALFKDATTPLSDYSSEFNKTYDYAYKRAAESLNNQLAARGNYDSTAAFKQQSDLTANIESQRAADYLARQQQSLQFLSSQGASATQTASAMQTATGQQIGGIYQQGALSQANAALGGGQLAAGAYQAQGSAEGGVLGNAGLQISNAQLSAGQNAAGALLQGGLGAANLGGNLTQAAAGLASSNASALANLNTSYSGIGAGLGQTGVLSLADANKSRADLIVGRQSANAAQQSSWAKAVLGAGGFVAGTVLSGGNPAVGAAASQALTGGR